MELHKKILDYQILLVLEQIFPMEHQAEAERILATEINSPPLENKSIHFLNRTRLAALKVSEGSVDKLKEAIVLAQKDRGDLLVRAGFAESLTAAEEWAEPIRQKAPDDRVSKFRIWFRYFCARPAMYVGSYSFSMAHAYIYGYLYGVSECQSGESISKHMDNFRIWCAEKFGTCRGHAWTEPIRKITKDDDEAFEQLFLLHEEFYREQLREIKRNADGSSADEREARITSET